MSEHVDGEKLLLEQKVRELKTALDRFITASNGLSVFVRSGISGGVNNPKLEKQLWELYELQCEVEGMV